jgi:hypothetical protein
MERNMTFNPADFTDDTDFERFMLNSLGTHRIQVTEPKYIYDNRNRSITGKLGMAEEGTRAREELRYSLHPLGFAAAYKVLDMLVEYVLRANGAPAGRLTFKWKRKNLQKQPITLPPPLNAHLELWDRLAVLYTKFQDARHAVTHRRCQVTKVGALEIFDDKRQRTDTISSAEIGFFAAAVHAGAELVIGVRDDSRRTNIAMWYLDKLQSRHRLPPLSLTDPNADRRLLVTDLVALDDGRLRFEVARAKEIIDRQPKPSLWDLRLHVGNRVFVGLWEEVEDQSTAALDFHPAMPPAWLSEEIILNGGQ